MKNIHVLPTDKPSRIYLIKSINKLGITSNNPEFTENFGSGTQNQNIYITSDEEIKVGDWFISLYSNSIQKELKLDCTLNKDAYKKIILTTDQSLDGVQAIDDEFLEWYVKNPSCEEVETKVEFLQTPDNLKDGFYYKIIIPKEEPKQECEYIKEYGCIKDICTCNTGPKQRLEKYSERFDNDKSPIGNPETWGKRMVEEPNYNMKQETLEEFSKRRNEEEKLNTYTHYTFEDAIKEGAKWQAERMYSEEEVLKLVSDWTDYRMSEDIKSKVKFKKWFEQFKNKGYEKHTHNTNR